MENSDYKPWGMELKPFCMCMYLSLFIGGPILTLVMWLTNKDYDDFLNAHGKNIFNWLLTAIICFIPTFILMFFFIGFLLWLALIGGHITFIILGAVKSYNGESFVFPVAIKFFK